MQVYTVFHLSFRCFYSEKTLNFVQRVLPLTLQNDNSVLCQEPSINSAQLTSRTGSDRPSILHVCNNILHLNTCCSFFSNLNFASDTGSASDNMWYVNGECLPK